MTPNKSTAEVTRVEKRVQIQKDLGSQTGRAECGEDAKRGAGVTLRTQTGAGEGKNNEGRGQ